MVDSKLYSRDSKIFNKKFFEQKRLINPDKVILGFHSHQKCQKGLDHHLIQVNETARDPRTEKLVQTAPVRDSVQNVHRH